MGYQFNEEPEDDDPHGELMKDLGFIAISAIAVAVFAGVVAWLLR